MPSPCVHCAVESGAWVTAPGSLMAPGRIATVTCPAAVSCVVTVADTAVAATTAAVNAVTHAALATILALGISSTIARADPARRKLSPDATRRGCPGDPESRSALHRRPGPPGSP